MIHIFLFLGPSIHPRNLKEFPHPFFSSAAPALELQGNNGFTSKSSTSG